ncbi:MAG: FtsX-like permease family protein [Acidimicrobiia bacterium]
MGAGLALTALTIYAAVTTRRRDFGRRRALGASRPDIMILILAQSLTVALVGATGGIVAGTILVQRAVAAAPDAGFALAVGVLAVAVAAVAALGPAVVAAYRDPVRILRVP